MLKLVGTGLYNIILGYMVPREHGNLNHFCASTMFKWITHTDSLIRMWKEAGQDIVGLLPCTNPEPLFM